MEIINAKVKGLKLICNGTVLLIAGVLLASCGTLHNLKHGDTYPHKWYETTGMWNKRMAKAHVEKCAATMTSQKEKRLSKEEKKKIIEEFPLKHEQYKREKAEMQFAEEKQQREVVEAELQKERQLRVAAEEKLVSKTQSLEKQLAEERQIRVDAKDSQKLGKAKTRKTKTVKTMTPAWVKREQDRPAPSEDKVCAELKAQFSGERLSDRWASDYKRRTGRNVPPEMMIAMRKADLITSNSTMTAEDLTDVECEIWMRMREEIIGYLATQELRKHSVTQDMCDIEHMTRNGMDYRHSGFGNVVRVYVPVAKHLSNKKYGNYTPKRQFYLVDVDPIAKTANYRGGQY